ncbi:MAG: EVE domain-containing protein [Paracoccus sp. (in: a-proteobacteria)]|jgi:predicted RNA-binding protein with PUA-like domain|uniref:EVE domain-containing protein n=1 Tax=Paracoccus TaxID=265 RepID=UPI000FD97799|nr:MULTISPECIES: EVE domain-containing protein [Paracoccus]AZY94957.1 EVE domain-containing protein [Paracoccus sp. Arc7-R13]MCO6363146.1 EVE domain-containing protein [Paracoccus sp. 08]TNB87684.1 EVE domain-containing protein [Paracoccus marcusii]WVJ73222.1 EVE domain-containing protein [Paracoccus marcusii]
MAHWLFKSEPDVFGWDDLVARGDAGEQWDGVRNYQARNNMRAMQVGELGLFYHSNIGKEAVGIVEVIALAHPDTTASDPKWECVDIRAVRKLPRAISLDEAKAEPRLRDMVLVNNSRLSVQPVSDAEWAVILELAGDRG